MNKNCDLSNLSDYRPIALLSCFCETFETTLKKKVLEHLTTSNLVFVHQYGFHKERSTGELAFLTYSFSFFDGLNILLCDIYERSFLVIIFFTYLCLTLPSTMRIQVNSQCINIKICIYSNNLSLLYMRYEPPIIKNNSIQWKIFCSSSSSNCYLKCKPNL